MVLKYRKFNKLILDIISIESPMLHKAAISLELFKVKSMNTVGKRIYDIDTKISRSIFNKETKEK